MNRDRLRKIVLEELQDRSHLRKPHGRFKLSDLLSELSDSNLLSLMDGVVINSGFQIDNLVEAIRPDGTEYPPEVVARAKELHVASGDATRSPDDFLAQAERERAVSASNGVEEKETIKLDPDVTTQLKQTQALDNNDNDDKGNDRTDDNDHRPGDTEGGPPVDTQGEVGNEDLKPIVPDPDASPTVDNRSARAAIDAAAGGSSPASRVTDDSRSGDNTENARERIRRILARVGAGQPASSNESARRLPSLIDLLYT